MRPLSVYSSVVALLAACAPGDDDRRLATACVAVEEAYVIAEGDTVTDPQTREYFARALDICDETAIPPEVEGDGAP